MKYSEISRINDKAERHIKNKQFDEAIELVKPIIEYDKINNPRAFMLRLLAEVKGDYQEVLKKCDSLIETEKEQYFYFTIKGNVYDDLKEYDKAIECYDKTLALNNNYICAYHGKGNVYFDLKEYYKALEWYDKVIEFDKKFMYAYYNKGIVYDNLKQYEKAIECYNKSIESDSEHVDTYNNKGTIYDDLKEYEKAIKCYDLAIKLDDNDDIIYKNRGNTFFKLKKYTNAINDYNRAIQINPDNKEKLEYWIERAEARLKEQKKNEQNEKRSEISQIIEDIKKLLEYNKDTQVCHYTSIDVFKALCEGSKLRFSHSNLVNDPTEGKTLYSFLNLPEIERKGESGFIGSFVESHNNNSLPLWRAYGRDGKGLSFCLEMEALAEFTIDKIDDDNTKETSTDSNKTIRKLYRIAYVDEKGKISLNGKNKKKKSKKIHKKLLKLKKLLEPLLNDHEIKNEEALEPVVEIQYLFKNAIYKGEREVRYYELLKDDYPLIEWDNNLQPPTTYIEVRNNILKSIRNVTVGPKAEDASTWVAWCKTMLAREGNKDVSVTQSKIPYR